MPPNDQDLARLYAEYLAQQTPPTYDDGASLLRGNPMALEVGWFGKGPKPKPVAPPVDIQRRRILGLNDIPEQKPSTQLPAISTPPSSVPAPTPAQAPLSSMAYKSLTTPMSRRQFLGNTARTAGQMALRGAVPELAKLAEPVVKAPLEQVAPEIVKDTFKVSPTLRKILKDRFDYEPLNYEHGTLENHLDLFTALKDFLPENIRNSPHIKALEQRVSEIPTEHEKSLIADKMDPFFDLLDEVRDTLPAIVDYVSEENLQRALADTGEYVVLDESEEGDLAYDSYDLGRALILHGHKPKDVLKYVETIDSSISEDPNMASDFLDFLKSEYNDLKGD